jgi:hypothetical protein
MKASISLRVGRLLEQHRIKIAKDWRPTRPKLLEWVKKELGLKDGEVTLSGIADIMKEIGLSYAPVISGRKSQKRSAGGTPNTRIRVIARSIRRLIEITGAHETFRSTEHGESLWRDLVSLSKTASLAPPETEGEDVSDTNGS